MPYVNQRWLGGLLTNFQTINRRIRRLHQLSDWTEDGTLELLPTRERITAINEREKLDMNLGGVRDMQRTPDAVFIVDLKTEAIAVREAERLRIPIIGLVDTNVDPEGVAYPIPGNDDAIRSCKVIVDAIGDVVAERANVFRAEEEAARREREEQERQQAEERAKREAEEAAAREAAQREADEKARAQAQALEAQEAQRQQQAAAEGQQGTGQQGTGPQGTGPQGTEGGPQPPSDDKTQEQQENAAEQGVSQ